MIAQKTKTGKISCFIAVLIMMACIGKAAELYLNCLEDLNYENNPTIAHVSGSISLKANVSNIVVYGRPEEENYIASEGLEYRWLVNGIQTGVQTDSITLSVGQ